MKIDPSRTFQRKLRKECPHCGEALSLMHYIGGLTEVCENLRCPWRGRGGGFFSRPHPEQKDDRSECNDV